MHRRAAVAALAAFWLAGAASAEDLPTYAVVLRGGRIEPSVLEVPAGRRVKLALRNEGPGPCEFENLELRVEKVLAPGASSFVVLAPLRPGRYRFIDEFHPDTGALDVVAK
jgi:hypothetical protein